LLKIQWDYLLTISWYKYRAYSSLNDFFRSFIRYLSKSLDTPVTYFAISTSESFASGSRTHIHVLLSFLNSPPVDYQDLIEAILLFLGSARDKYFIQEKHKYFKNLQKHAIVLKKCSSQQQRRRLQQDLEIAKVEDQIMNIHRKSFKYSTRCFCSFYLSTSDPEHAYNFINYSLQPHHLLNEFDFFFSPTLKHRVKKYCKSSA